MSRMQGLSWIVLLAVVLLPKEAHLASLKNVPPQSMFDEAKHVVIARVVGATKSKDQAATQHVTLLVTAWLKGRATTQRITLDNVTQGMMGFSPSVKAGQDVVAFLADIDAAGHSSLSYPIGLAIFPKELPEP